MVWGYVLATLGMVALVFIVRALFKRKNGYLVTHTSGTVGGGGLWDKIKDACCKRNK